ncbi:MAG: hypothetical protein EOM83_14245 [Clostridia bacterium]|nr:hypothetical protein [Clostridia bacterium]
MKKYFYPLIVLACTILTNVLHAGVVPEQTARNVAQNYYHQQFTVAARPQQLDISLAEVRQIESTPVYYIYNVASQGFIIVSASDATIPVLAFSDEGTWLIDEAWQKVGFREMLDNYADQILFVENQKLEATDEIRLEWQKWEKTQTDGGSQRSVTPLLSTTWGQHCYYNELCPTDASSPTGYCGHVPVGCNAVSMGQVMRYWGFPVTGTGSNSYNIAPYGIQSANFGTATYDYASMPTAIASSNLAVATLLYHCGVSMGMQYGPTGSSSQFDIMYHALLNNFNFSDEAICVAKSVYSDAQWETLLRSDLDEGKPVIYRGTGEQAGHGWVCDGYTGTNYFHMNWGWAGVNNGYFYLNNLNPGTYNLTNNQAAIFHLSPEDVNIAPPVNLQAQVAGNNVTLSWSAPPQPQWIHWDEGFTWSYFALSGTSTYRMAFKYTPADLQSLEGMYLTRFAADMGQASAGYQLKIYKGAAGTNLIYSQTLTNFVAQTWNTFELTTPVEIDADSDLYICLLVTNADNNTLTAGLDDGPSVAGRGDLISFDGATWTNLSVFGINRNFSMRAFVDMAPDGKTLSTGKWIEDPVVSAPSGKIEIKIIPATGNAFDNGKSLLGYNVYRNNAKINTSLVTGTTFANNNVPSGSYSYHVITVFNGGESAASVPVYVSPGALLQNYPLAAGWNSISSHLVPAFADLATICNPIQNEVVMLSGLTGYYYPEYGINTLGEWNMKKGYMIKVSNACTLPFSGFTNTSTSIGLTTGWNLISVLSACQVNTVQLFSNVLSKLIILQEAAGTGVYWPEKGVNTLPVLTPGKSYFVKMSAARTIVFPACKE